MQIKQQKDIYKIRKNISYYSKYPLFVSEGTWQNKLSKIRKNIYLNHCYKSLSSIGTKNSSLVIFGTLLKRNDTHIRKAILKSKVENIYIGVSNEDEAKEFDDVEKMKEITKVEKTLEKK